MSVRGPGLYERGPGLTVRGPGVFERGPGLSVRWPSRALPDLSVRCLTFLFWPLSKDS